MTAGTDTPTRTVQASTLGADGQLPLPAARFLTRTQAAAYVGVSPSTFDAEVRSGTWPPALRRGAKGRALTWDKHSLDRAADRLGGLSNIGGPDEDLKAAEQAALEATARGTSSPNRHQHRHTKAA